MSEDFKYRWKDEVAPELNNDFKWRFAMDALKPKMQIEGPSVGSLLYAMNPKTSELGLKQMDSELNQQLAANANFDKRGDAAMKFMEQRVAEDIANKQFADKMALEQIKAQNVDAGHLNSLMRNGIDAYANGDKVNQQLFEEQIRKTMPNAEQIINEARQTAALKQQQNALAEKILVPGLNGMYETAADKKKAFDELDKIRQEIGEENYWKKYKEIYSVPDRESKLAYDKQVAQINALAGFAGGKAGGKAKVNDYNTWLAKNKKRLQDQGYETPHSWKKQYEAETGMEAPK